MAILNRNGVTWLDFQPVLEKIDTTSELKAAVSDPEAFFKEFFFYFSFLFIFS